MFYQLTFRVLPGLKGLSCTGFRAVATEAPNLDQGVAFEAPDDAAAQAFVGGLEAHFAPQRFSNSAAAFESVKECVISRSPALRKSPG